MSERIGKLLNEGSLFGMNCDRHVNEAQITEYSPAAVHHEDVLHTSYLEIDQVTETFAYVISRPEWAWGGEMGVNECGVCAGLSEVPTLRRMKRAGLIGMDLLRLALERSATAAEAVSWITELLEAYGQGGNTGYSHLCYSNSSFLIMDAEELYVLEACDRDWAWLRKDAAALSSFFVIAGDGEAYSSDLVCDFRKAHGGAVRSILNGSARRTEWMKRGIPALETAEELRILLTGHRSPLARPQKRGTDAGMCRHAGAYDAVGTTASMIVQGGASPRLWMTGCSAPCIALYKPWSFSCRPVPPVCMADGTDSAAYWLQAEAFHRLTIGKRLPKEFFAQREELQSDWFSKAAQLDNAHLYELSRKAAAEESAFYGRWRGALLTPRKGDRLFLEAWKRRDQMLNASVLRSEERPDPDE